MSKKTLFSPWSTFQQTLSWLLRAYFFGGKAVHRVFINTTQRLSFEERENWNLQKEKETMVPVDASKTDNLSVDSVGHVVTAWSKRDGLTVKAESGGLQPGQRIHQGLPSVPGRHGCCHGGDGPATSGQLGCQAGHGRRPAVGPPRQEESVQGSGKHRRAVVGQLGTVRRGCGLESADVVCACKEEKKE